MPDTAGPKNAHGRVAFNACDATRLARTALGVMEHVSHKIRGNTESNMLRSGVYKVVEGVVYDYSPNASRSFFNAERIGKQRPPEWMPQFCKGRTGGA